MAQYIGFSTINACLPQTTNNVSGLAARSLDGGLGLQQPLNPGKKFRFASQQSEAGKKILASFHISETKQESIFLIIDQQLFKASEAVLLIAKELKGFPRLFYWCIYLPAAFRDWIYFLVSKNRYHWFGKKTECWIPDSNLSSLFLRN